MIRPRAERLSSLLACNHCLSSLSREILGEVQLKTVKIDKPADMNFILGQSHFIKTVEDLYEASVQTVPGIKFGIGVCESSGPALIRCAGNDPNLIRLAQENALALSCGHCFIIFMEKAYPINILNA